MSDQSTSPNKGELLDLLHDGICKARRRSRGNHWISHVVMGLALLASAVAGVAGLASYLDRKVVGAIALVPGTLALISSTMKFSERAAYHNRKKRALQRLWRQLKFELPNAPSDDQVALISSRFTEVDTQFGNEWDAKFVANLQWVDAKTRKIED